MCNSMNRNFVSAIDWADAYKTLVNEHDIRSVIINCNDAAYGDTEYGVRTHLTSGRGTIYHPDPDDDELAHFMAFARSRASTLIYDPAGGQSPYAVRGSELRLQRQTFKDMFGTAIRLSPLFHQIEQGDTWCQTWSFAWIDNSLRDRLSVSFTDPKDSRACMQGIIDVVLARMVERLRGANRAVARQLLSDWPWYRRRFHLFY